MVFLFNRSLFSVLSVAALGVMLSVSAHAEVSVISTISDSTAPTLFVPGILLSAINFGGDNLVREGISFIGFQTPPASPTASLTSEGLDITTSSLFASDLFNTTIGPDALFESEIYTSDQGTQLLSVTGLDPAQTYTFQFLHGDTRPGVIYYADMTYTDTDGNSATENLLFGLEGTNYVIRTVQVSGTTSLTSTMPNGGRGPSYSGLIISQNANVTAPEPGSITLLLPIAGVVGVVIRRRKK